MKFSPLLILMLFLLASCNETKDQQIAHNALETISKEAPKDNRQLSEAFKQYWYAGNAEITSYKLSQERYGELREGTAVNIFVTEDFLPDAQVKSDRSASDNTPVLKLNQTKNYVTGIYPYSVMTSTFSAVNKMSPALKISHSMQEWCGHVYVQLNNRENFEITQHSYFEGEADKTISLKKEWLENDIWNLIRLNPEELPIGDFIMVPTFEYFRMSHKKIAAQKVSAKRIDNNNMASYELRYPELNRTLVINFSKEFPHNIEGWQETHANGLITAAKKMKRIKTAYWGQNSTTFEHLRDSLGL